MVIGEDPHAWLSDADVDMARGYDDIVMLRGVQLQSFCEHHMTPFEGKVHLAYLPDQKVVGLSRLARVVDTLAKRLQTQEALTETDRGDARSRVGTTRRCDPDRGRASVHVAAWHSPGRRRRHYAPLHRGPSKPTKRCLIGS